MYNIIARGTLIEYCKKYSSAATALQAWYHEMLTGSFTNFNELKSQFGSTSLVGDDKVIFNISGNKFRLIVQVVFVYKTIQIKWFRTHSEYNKIDAVHIQFKKK